MTPFLKDGSLAQFGCKSNAAEGVKPEQTPNDYTEIPSSKASKQSWSRLIRKVYEADPLVCPKCSHKTRIVAVITDPLEVNKILGCLKRNHAPPFEKVVTKAS